MQRGACRCVLDGLYLFKPITPKINIDYDISERCKIQLIAVVIIKTWHVKVQFKPVTVFYMQSLQKTSRMFESLGKVIEETGISFKPKLVEEDKLNMAQQLKNAREQYDR